MDSILTYHSNPLTCGIARFNTALSRHMDVPCIELFSEAGLKAKAPLVSIKISEFSQLDIERLSAIAEDPMVWPELRLFFHDYTDTLLEAALMARAKKVYCGNEALKTKLAKLHPHTALAWCPGYLFDTKPFNDHAEITVYTFGMAHKLRTDHYYRLYELLEATGKPYAVYISAAIHEGKSLDDSFTSAYEELEACFGEKIHFLGFVSDAALYNYLNKSTFFAAFFPEGVRANNTSVNTAMQCGAVVITNLDEFSPPEFRHLEAVVDIRQCGGGLPLDAALLDRIRDSGRAYAARTGWAPLVDLIRREEDTIAASTSTQRARA